jgi:hypothetical protein
MNVKEEIKLNNYSFIIGDEVKHNLCFFVVHATSDYFRAFFIFVHILRARQKSIWMIFFHCR